MKMERPTAFEGPGYCLMRQGSLRKAESEMTHLGVDEKLKLCAKELIQELPNIKLEDVKQTDSEEDTSQKLMAQVKFESVMFGVQQKFGEDVLKDVLNATKATSSADVPQVLRDSSELADLIAKLKVCGILDLPLSGSAAAPSAPAPPASKETSAETSEKPATGAEPTAKSGMSPAVAGVVALSLAAVAATALLLWRRQRR